MKKFFLFLLLLSCGLLVFAQETDRVLAMVDKEVITQQDITQYSASLQTEMQKRNLSPQQIQQQMSSLQKDILNQLIEQELVYLEFKRLKGRIPTEYLQQQINQQIEEQAGGNQTRFEDMLFQQGLTMKSYREKLFKQLAVELLLREKTQRGTRIPITDIQKFYQEHPDFFQRKRQIRMAVIQLKNTGKYHGKLEETANEIRRHLADGELFEELAKKYSEGMNAEQGGDLGWQPELAPALENAAKSLAIGQIHSQNISIANSLCIVKLLGREEGGMTPLNEEITQKISSYLEQMEVLKRRQQFVQELYSRYPVVRF